MRYAIEEHKIDVDASEAVDEAFEFIVQSHYRLDEAAEEWESLLVLDITSSHTLLAIWARTALCSVVSMKIMQREESIANEQDGVLEDYQHPNHQVDVDASNYWLRYRHFDEHTDDLYHAWCFESDIAVSVSYKVTNFDRSCAVLLGRLKDDGLANVHEDLKPFLHDEDWQLILGEDWKTELAVARLKS